MKPLPTIDQPNEARLQRDVRFLKIYSVALTTLLGAVLFFVAARPTDSGKRFSEITAERINIVDANGRNRFVLTNSARVPNPIINGKEGKRIIQPAGIIFYDEQGDEAGGIALSQNKSGKLSAFLLDYDESEATGFYRRIAPDGKGYAAFFINDQPPPGTPASAAMDVDRGRIKLQNPERNAEILLTDPQGRNRIQLRVDQSGEAKIEILDAAGKVVFRAPNEKAE